MARDWCVRRRASKQASIAGLSKEDFQQQLKDLEAVSNPIVTKLYGAAGGAGGAPGGDAGYAQEDDLPADHDDL